MELYDGMILSQTLSSQLLKMQFDDGKYDCGVYI